MKPDYGVLDGGATCFMAGDETLRQYLDELRRRGFDVSSKACDPCNRPSRFGNSQVMEARLCVDLPVFFKQRKGRMLIYVVPCSAPILSPRPLMETFQVVTIFAKETSSWHGGELEPAISNQQGRCLIDLLEHYHHYSETDPDDFVYIPSDVDRYLIAAPFTQTRWSTRSNLIFLARQV
jgi:hypothetical protein